MNYFVVLLCVLDVFAAFWEVFHGNPVKAWYWMSAMSITASTIFMK